MKTVIQFIKFSVVGLSNTLMAFLIYYPLVYFGANYLIANVLAFIISVLNAYYWQNRYVFDKGTQSHWLALFKVYVSYGFSFILSMVLLFIQVDVFDISKYTAPVVNLLITVPLNFLVNKFWAYEERVG